MKELEKLKRNNGQLVGENQSFYVVMRIVKLKNKASKKSTVLETLYPNQKVCLEERKGKWIRISYYNHLKGIHQNGWVMKKYLKSL